MATTPRPRKRPRSHDTSDPAIITDHPFEPEGEWYSLCKHCRLAQAAHSTSTIDSRDYVTRNRPTGIGYVGDDTDGYNVTID